MRWLNIMLLCAEQKDGEVYEVVEMPPEEEEELKESEETEQSAAPAGLVKVFRFIMKQSYVCALIAMMVSRSRFNQSNPVVFNVHSNMTQSATRSYHRNILYVRK